MTVVPSRDCFASQSPGRVAPEALVELSEAAVWESAGDAWRFRPSQSKRLLEATTVAWREAAEIDEDIHIELYHEVE